MSAAPCQTLDTAPRHLTVGPVTRLDLALYCGASGDHNPIHVDLDHARSIGMADVVGHGMLSMAHLGRLVARFAPQTRLRAFQARFVAPVEIGDVLTATGEVAERIREDGEARARLVLTMRDQRGVLKLTGEALIALPAPPTPPFGSAIPDPPR